MLGNFMNMTMQVIVLLIYALSSKVAGRCYVRNNEQPSTSRQSIVIPSYAYDEWYNSPTPPPPPPIQMLSKTIICTYLSLDSGLQIYGIYNNGLDCTHCKVTLEVSNSHISTLPPSAFIKYPAITKIALQTLQIEKIVPGAFNSMNNLEELYLSGNNLMQISDGIFNSLVLLRVLDLSKNSIQNISIHSFTGTLNLELLNLSSNSLKLFDNNVFVHLTKVKTLDLSYNYLSKFNFIEVPNTVENLNLFNNLISSIDGCFTKFTKLDLGNNKLNSLENSFICLDISSKVNNIQFLSLANNCINTIPNGFFSNLNSLKFLNLSSNQLEEFKCGLFDNLQALDILDLSGNKLKVFKNTNFHSLIMLQELYLQNNEITFLEYQDLMRYSKLRVISLDGNKFSCENLVNILRSFGYSKLSKGKTFNTSNIHGISCSENNNALDLNASQSSETGTNIENTFLSKLDQLFNSSFSKSLMYNFFNRDFKNSNFFKYLETLKFRGDFAKTNMYNYLNQEFKNTTFYKYLENMKTFNSNLSNYFSEDFKNTNFLKSPQFVVKHYDQNKTKIEKIVSNFDEDIDVSYSALLIIITLLLVVIASVMGLSMYMIYKQFNNIKNVQMELVEA